MFLSLIFFVYHVFIKLFMDGAMCTQFRYMRVYRNGLVLVKKATISVCVCGPLSNNGFQFVHQCTVHYAYHEFIGLTVLLTRALWHFKQNRTQCRFVEIVLLHTKNIVARFARSRPKAHNLTIEDSYMHIHIRVYPQRTSMIRYVSTTHVSLRFRRYSKMPTNYRRCRRVQ